MEGSAAIPDDASRRKCFVVSAFGSSGEEQRTYKQVLKHLVRKVLDADYDVVRADQIDDEGLITNQVIEHLLDDDLVVADLTGLNPNVFYEIAVRHAARKPIVHLITKGQEIPFDVANMRAVQYALDDPDLLEEAQGELRRKVDAIEAGDFKAAPNPVSVARDIWLLRESEQPDVRQAGDFLASLNELRDEVRSLSRRVGGTPQEAERIVGDWDTRRNSVKTEEVETALERLQPVRAEVLAAVLGIEDSLARYVLKSLADKSKAAVHSADGTWTISDGKASGD
jgi:hypothetical protein